MKKLSLIFLVLISNSVYGACFELRKSIMGYQAYIENRKGILANISPAPYDAEGLAVKQEKVIQNRPDIVPKYQRELDQAITNMLRNLSSNDNIVVLNEEYFKPILKFAKLGNIDAQFCVAVLYEFGLGTKRAVPIAYGFAAAAVAQNPPFGEEFREDIASKLSPNGQAQGIEAANQIMKNFTDLYDQPVKVLIQ